MDIDKLQYYVHSSTMKIEEILDEIDSWKSFEHAQGLDSHALELKKIAKEYLEELEQFVSKAGQFDAYRVKDFIMMYDDFISNTVSQKEAALHEVMREFYSQYLRICD